MAKRIKKVPQKEKLLEVPAVNIRKKNRRKIVKQILPDPYQLFIYGTPCRKEDLFSVSVAEITQRWSKSKLYSLSKNCRIISPATLFWEFIASELNGESVPGVTTGKMGLLFETVTKTLSANEKEKTSSAQRRKAEALL